MQEGHKKKEKKLARSLISHSAMHRRCTITEYFPILVTMFLPYHWTWSKGYHRYSCFIPWPTPFVTDSVDQCWKWNFTIKDFLFWFSYREFLFKWSNTLALLTHFPFFISDFLVYDYAITWIQHGGKIQI